ncbi:hypothetical protein [Variovorax sp. RB3P1]|uniref:hypothetical protein n=1 Tax=Variovorax sp. RB3P1 TaxID=3443732 RepID=UPI003F491E65
MLEREGYEGEQQAALAECIKPILKEQQQVARGFRRFRDALANNQLSKPRSGGASIH